MQWRNMSYIFYELKHQIPIILNLNFSGTQRET